MAISHYEPAVFFYKISSSRICVRAGLKPKCQYVRIATSSNKPVNFCGTGLVCEFRSSLRYGRKSRGLAGRNAVNHAEELSLPPRDHANRG